MVRTYRIIEGDALNGGKSVPDATAAVCVTSPPYYGLRSYGTQPQVWGGAADCEHVWDAVVRETRLQNNLGNNGSLSPDRNKQIYTAVSESGTCITCGAWRGELGQEPTPELFIEHLVEVFREVRRILRPDGTLWVNIGDSYASIAGGYDTTGSRGTSAKISARTQAAVISHKQRHPPSGLKPKDLIGIPWMLAFALRADGWYLRQELIWAKPNPMPESVTDRCTKAHEHIFLLSKSPRYYFNAEAIAEPAVLATQQRAARGVSTSHKNISVPGRTTHTLHKARANGEGYDFPDTRNKRSVWTVPTKPFSEAHFAVFPPELIEPCILAGSKEGDTVYDPFTGSGTTGLVALRHGRNFIGSELNPAYAEMARRRIHMDAPLLNTEEAA